MSEALRWGTRVRDVGMLSLTHGVRLPTASQQTPGATPDSIAAVMQHSGAAGLARHEQRHEMC